jgi:hypothetical protein
MRRFLYAVGIAAAVLLTVSAATLSFAVTRHKPVMVGVEVAKGVASIEAADQLGVQGALQVARVVAPGPSWVVIYNQTSQGGMNMSSAARAGIVHVPAGVSIDVKVPLDPNVRMTQYVDVVLQADRGVLSVFEFDPKNFAASPDKPYYVGRKRVQVKVLVRFNEMEG